MKVRNTTLVSMVSLFGAIAGAAHAQPEYDFVLIDSYNANPLAGETRMSGISDNGIACGVTTVDNVIGYPGIAWSLAAGKTRIPVSNPSAVNSSGLVVGIGTVYDLVTQATYSPPNLPGTYYSPSFGDVNNSGIAVGTISTTSGSDSGGILRIPYIWDAVNGARTISVPNAKSLHRINNVGVALGWMNNLMSQGPFVVDLASGAYTAIVDVLPPDFGVGYPYANDINDHGEIVGSRPGTYPIYRYGFMYSSSTGLHVLPFPGAGYQQYVSPTAINNAGTIVGNISTVLASQHVFVYSESHGLRDLNEGSLIAGMPAGYRLYFASNINNQGWIVGYGHTAAGKITGFVLKPRGASCSADFNRDGTLDFFDYLDFVDGFSGNAAAADFNGDGIIDFFDYLDFVDSYQAGC